MELQGVYVLIEIADETVPVDPVFVRPAPITGLIHPEIKETRSITAVYFLSAMTSVQTPPLSRSGSSPSNVGMANRSGPSSAPPTSLSLRSSYNQLLGRDVIKESMETGSSATLPKSRQRHTMTSVRSAMGISDNLSSKNQPVTRGRGLPTKSSSSSALYSSSSSMFNTTNPKLAKNGANMQRRAESQQQELSRANTEEKIHNDLLNNPSSDWLESGKDNSQLPPFQWVPDNQNLLQSHAPAQVREELCAQVQVSPCSPAKPPRSSQPRIIKVELHPNNENQFLQQYPPSSPKQARAAERSTPTRTRAPCPDRP
ncbi:hypothetical protein F7725_010062 [Dissostichus mawsoni]|uniref:Uncharacterized protein n=1 Tax=Dissostichus mawsoni TaxID=36200 RepID=A0A7J5XMK7_DISMA|nr:hypothetical protein F7725_010062 [Dissostichus mawsoni]